VKADTYASYKERILRVLVHVQEHLDEAISLEVLARVACFSPYHFHRVFQGMVGEGVMEHVRRLRLERAAQRLKLTEQPVTRIAFDAGYETHESFTRAFTAMFGDAPSRFRENHTPPPLRKVPSGVHYLADGKLDSFTIADTGGATMDVRIERVVPMRVAFMRNIGPYNTCGATWEKLCRWAGPRRLLGPRTLFIGLSHDDPQITPPEKLRYDACFTVGKEFTPEGEVGVQEIGGGEYAVTTHRGPYEKLNETYATLCGQWMPAHGRELGSAPCFEIYRNDPNSTPPEDLITDVYVPLAT
jgi:AraC family transcriptional regulator